MDFHFLVGVAAVFAFRTQLHRLSWQDILAEWYTDDDHKEEDDQEKEEIEEVQEAEWKE